MADRILIKIYTESNDIWWKAARLSLEMASKYPIIKEIIAIAYDTPWPFYGTPSEGELHLACFLHSERYNERCCLETNLPLESFDSKETRENMIALLDIPMRLKIAEEHYPSMIGVGGMERVG